MIGVLMSLNAVGVFGFLTKAHLDHMTAVDLPLADSLGVVSRAVVQSRVRRSADFADRPVVEHLWLSSDLRTCDSGRQRPTCYPPAPKHLSDDFLPLPLSSD